MARGKVITTHLRTGDPNGIRTVFISNKICEMIVFPRSEFDQVGKLPESSLPALYVLIGKDDMGNDEAYIGETTNGLKRINNHKSGKMFWDKCLMFVAKDESINKADVQYLESKAIDLANDCGRYSISNEKSGNNNSLSVYQVDIMEEFFDDVKLLTSFIGCPIFEKAIKAPSVSDANKFHLKVRECDAYAIFNESDHTLCVLRGSKLPQSVVPSYRDGAKRNAAMPSYAKLGNDGYWTLQKEWVFTSPSTAASYCSGRSCNGWLHWTREDGLTLDEIYRKD